MRNLLLTTAIAFALSAPAFAAGSHSGGHDEAKVDNHAADHAAMMLVGKPGTAEDVDRTVDVIMRETEDGQMIFEPASFDIEPGETIRFKVKNAGEQEHEFVLDTIEQNVVHKAMMAEMDMEHDDPNSIRLDAGGEGEVIWTFENEGTFEFACLIPGHYESGMYGPITVGETQASAETVLAQADVEYTTGTIKKVDAEGGKVTINHGPLVNLDMPAMTMVFRADEAMLAKMSEGQEIEFVAEPVKGKLTVTQLR